MPLSGSIQDIALYSILKGELQPYSLSTALNAALPRDTLTQLLTAGQNLRSCCFNQNSARHLIPPVAPSIVLHLSFRISGCLQQ